ncbi:MAG TPA: hypothetical protein VL463_32090 [Kofleriaceae bacterium]|jgi:hypothetical protein|nr:hypothetical protein [Kofleriaceae bacterium]
MRRVWIVLGVVGLAARAHAEPIRIAYDAPAGCPDAAAFEASVREREPSVPIDPSAARTFEVRVTAGADGFVGALTTPDAKTSQIDAPRCDDLVLALAFMTALAIGTDAHDHAAPPPPPPRPPPPAPSLPWRLSAILAPEVELGVTPDALPAASIEARVARGSLHADLGAIAGRDTTSTKAGDARFTWLVGRASGCWTALDRAIALDACAHVEFGMLEAAGVDVVRAQDVRRSWLAAGAHLAARYDLGAKVFAELRAGASAPFFRDRFSFAPDVFIHQAASITPWFGVGVGLRFR